MSYLKSKLDKNYKPKGKKSLSSFKKVKMTNDIIDKLLEDPDPACQMGRHIDTDDECYGWFDGKKFVGVVCVDHSKKKDRYDWITAIAITKNYKGYGLGKQILDYAVKKMNGNALTVMIDNEVAKKMYEDYGFKTSKESIEDVKAGRRKVYFMYLDNAIKEMGLFDNIAFI